MNDSKWGEDIYLPQIVNNFYDETANMPSLGYIIGYANSNAFPVCIDTGAGKSLMKEEIWTKINANKKYELIPNFRGFFYDFEAKWS